MQGTTSRLGRRRAAVLVGVHLAIGLHFAHWWIAGRTLAPLELNEVMYTLELGLLTAGFLLMATAAVSVAVFGRFFCSWGCHVLALQDLSAWLLARLHLRPTPIRSRLLRWVPVGAVFSMLAWPQIKRLALALWPAAEGLLGASPPFRLRLATDAEGWASFLTDHLTRNLPGPGIATVTLVLCGFVMIRLLGTRSFCRDVCPYGAVFSLADRFAPGRIVLAGACTSCGRCTATCDSGIQVQAEVARWGAVRSGDCLKDLDCVGVCPTGGLRFGWTRPPFFGPRRLARRPELTWAEECAAASAFLATLVTCRGLYRLLPFLLSLALAVLAAVATVVALRLVRRPEVRLQRWLLKRDGRWSRTGIAAGAAIALFAALVAESGVVRAAEVASDRAWWSWRTAQQRGGPDRMVEARLLAALDVRARWGLLRPADLGIRRAAVRTARAEELVAEGRFDSALAELTSAIESHPQNAIAHYDLGVVLSALDRDGDAMAAYQEAIRLDPGDAESANNLGFLLWRYGALEQAEARFRQAMKLSPTYALPCSNLSALLTERGRTQAARELAALCPPKSP